MRGYSDDQTKRKCRFLRGSLKIIIKIIKIIIMVANLKGDATTIILPEISDWRSLPTEPPFGQGRTCHSFIKSRPWPPFSEALQSPPPTRPPPHTIFLASSSPVPTILLNTMAQAATNTQSSSADRPERSRNAKAQARHRAKRKAYIEQVNTYRRPVWLFSLSALTVYTFSSFSISTLTRAT